MDGDGDEQDDGDGRRYVDGEFTHFTCPEDFAYAYNKSNYPSICQFTSCSQEVSEEGDYCSAHQTHVCVAVNCHMIVSYPALACNSHQHFCVESGFVIIA